MFTQNFFRCKHCGNFVGLLNNAGMPLIFCGEEEKNSKDLIAKFELFAGDGKGLYMLNAELLTRVYVPSTHVL